MKFRDYTIINTLNESVQILMFGEVVTIEPDVEYSKIFDKIGNINGYTIMSKDIEVAHEYLKKANGDKLLIIVSPLTCAYFKLKYFAALMTKELHTSGLYVYDVNKAIRFM